MCSEFGGSQLNSYHITRTPCLRLRESLACCSLARPRRPHKSRALLGQGWGAVEIRRGIRFPGLLHPALGIGNRREAPQPASVPLISHLTCSIGPALGRRMRQAPASCCLSHSPRPCLQHGAWVPLGLLTSHKPPHCRAAQRSFSPPPHTQNTRGRASLWRHLGDGRQK